MGASKSENDDYEKYSRLREKRERIKRIKKKIEIEKRLIRSLLNDNSIRLYLTLSIIIFSILMIRDYKVGFLSVDWGGVWVEAHGMFFDLLILGLLLAIYNFYRERKYKINHYREQIDDFRYWDEPEATYRIAGVLKRLDKLEVQNIDISNCRLSNSNLGGLNLKFANISNANLSHTKLGQANLEKANISNADLSHTKLGYANLEKANMNSAKLFAASLLGANLIYADLRNADLRGIEIIGFTPVIDMDLSDFYLDYVIKPNNYHNYQPKTIELSPIPDANLKGVYLNNAKIYEYQLEQLEQCGAYQNEINKVITYKNPECIFRDKFGVVRQKKIE